MNKFLKEAQTIAVQDLFGYTKIKDSTLNLGIGEPAFETPQIIKETLIESIRSNTHGYTHAQGKLLAREAIVNHYCAPLDVENILITQGSSEAFSCIIYALLNPGDEVLIPTPSYPLYQSICAMAGVSYRQFSTQDDNYNLNIATLKQYISPKTKALILTSPDNPTGKVIPTDIIKEILNTTDLLVVVDQVYADLVYDEDFHCLSPQDHPNLLVIQSFSKTYAMTGWRLAYLLAHKDLMAALVKWQQNVLTSISSFIQDVIPVALAVDTSTMRTHYKIQRDKTCLALDKMGLKYVWPQAAFYVLIDIKPFNLDSVSFCQKCHDEVNLLLVPGVYFGAEGTVRLSFSVDDSVLMQGLKALEMFIGGL